MYLLESIVPFGVELLSSRETPYDSSFIETCLLSRTDSVIVFVESILELNSTVMSCIEVEEETYEEEEEEEEEDNAAIAVSSPEIG